MLLCFGWWACLFVFCIDLFCYSEGHEGYTVWALHNQWEEVEEDSDGEVPGRYQEMFYLADRSLSAAAPAEDMDTAE